MLVQRVVSPTTRQESWTVLGDDDVPVAAIERYLSYLTDIERSPAAFDPSPPPVVVDRRPRWEVVRE